MRHLWKHTEAGLEAQKWRLVRGGEGMGAAKKQLGDLGSQEGCGPPWGSVLSMSLAQFRMARKDIWSCVPWGSCTPVLIIIMPSTHHSCPREQGPATW